MLSALLWLCLSSASAVCSHAERCRYAVAAQEDKHKLLAVIETGFGDLRPFNRVVRAILKERVDVADQEGV